jgi:predicted metal-binding membrane protein
MQSSAGRLVAGQPALVALLAGLSAVGWAWSLRMPHAHHGASLAALFVMWATMMVGMMIPPEAPALLRLGRAQRFPAAARFLAGFLAPWIAFSFAAAALQSWLQASGLLDHHMAMNSIAQAAGLLLVAGALQLSPMKRACLARCREAAPVEQHFAAGLSRSLLSIGSCGLLMLALFATGVMSLPAMALLTLLLLLEHWPLRGMAVSYGAGILLLVAGATKFGGVW